jgi:hypothetical protein
MTIDGRSWDLAIFSMRAVTLGFDGRVRSEEILPSPLLVDWSGKRPHRTSQHSLLGKVDPSRAFYAPEA